MAKEKFHPCGPKGFCKGMQLHFSEPNRRGINAVRLFNLNTSAERIIGVAFKKTEGDRGIMLNYCPQCGKSLAFMLNAKPRRRKALSASHGSE